MNIALQTSAPRSFEIKSANLSLMALRLKSPDLALLAEEMAMRFGDMPEFFDQDLVVIDLSALQTPVMAASKPEIDFAALVALLTSYRMVPIAVRAGSSAQMTAALSAYLLPLPEIPAAGSRIAQNAKAAELQTAAEVSADAATITAQTAPATASELAGSSSNMPTSALVIDKPLRSGQQVYARGRDLVVMAMVNPGAEVIADGHIHVYAPLRGKAIAGARGNTEARIFSLALDAELLSIAGVYRTSDTPLPKSLMGQPVQVRLMPDEVAATPVIAGAAAVPPAVGSGTLVMTLIQG